MSIEQIIVLALVQGITEFLPISSSGHLILVPLLTGWSDQGLTTDVMVHVGSLFAILAYFWRDVWQLVLGALDLIRLNWSPRGRLALYIVAATIPAVIFGLALKALDVTDGLRNMELIGWTAIIYGALLYAADRFGPQLKAMEQITFGPAMIIGVAQALALIPGTSRSGITMTAARFMGFTRPEAARFSFLLGIPAIAGAGLLTAIEAAQNGEAISNDALLAAALTFVSAFAAIAFLMALVKRVSFLPFVIYRFVLGGFLLVLAYSA